MSKIKVKPEAAPGQVLEIVRGIAEERGYLWEQDSASTAVASEGGKRVGPKVTAMRLQLRLTVQEDKLKLSQETNGAVYAGAAGAGFFMVRLNIEASKFRKLAKKALAEAGLA